LAASGEVSATAPSDEGRPVSIHASAVIVGESGIIIRGASGAGKSSLALGLIEAAERAGRFARLVGDDRIELRRRGGRLIAHGHRLVSGKVERRGQGILEVAYEPAVVARLVVELLAARRAERYPENESGAVTLCGVDLPSLSLVKDAGAYDAALAVLACLERTETI
jgi:HPr kinase/phosphorylase